VSEIIATAKFQWNDRLACVEQLALICADGYTFDKALKVILMHEYGTGKMPGKQKASLKRDVQQRAKEITSERMSPDVGDIVKVPKMIPTGTLLGGFKRDGLHFAEAEVIDIIRSSSWVKYKVKRLKDGVVQEGNGHMIKMIVSRASESKAVGGGTC
jgi:hypothetical protein